MYTPKPADTSSFPLPQELQGLVEAMAKNVHENWANARIKEGWRLGPVRNDKIKTHPCLVEYEKLSEEEKEYDRLTAIQTLKFILSQGFSIVSPQKS